jgi:hypothetical protein
MNPAKGSLAVISDSTTMAETTGGAGDCHAEKGRSAVIVLPVVGA